MTVETVEMNVAGKASTATPMDIDNNQHETKVTQSSRTVKDIGDMYVLTAFHLH
jgi:hypothetical protein